MNSRIATKKRFVIYLLICLFPYTGIWDLFAQDTTSEIQTVVIEDGVMCYKGSDYVIRIDDLAPSQEVAAIPQSEDREDECFARISESVISFSLLDEPRYFIDLRGPNLIIDSGCCPGFRYLEIYNLDKSELLYESPYWANEPVTWVDSSSISFWMVTNGEKKDCTAADEYEELGGSYGFEERVIFYLDNKKLSPTGEIKCSYRM